MRGVQRAMTAFVVWMLTGPGAAAAARCDDITSVAAAQAAVDAAVSCDGVVSRAEYVKRGKGALEGAALSPACRRRFVTERLRRSVCGRPGSVVCCAVNQKGRDVSRVVREGRCVNGMACPTVVGFPRSVGEGCTASGSCAAAPTTTTTTSTTTTTQPPPCDVSQITTCDPSIESFDLTTVAGTGFCGQTFADAAGTSPLRSLACGGFNTGSALPGLSEARIPDGARSRFGACCRGSCCRLDPAPAAAPGVGCTEAGCLFGPPIALQGSTPACLVPTLTAPASGVVDASAGRALLALELNAQVFLRTAGGDPCPRCLAAPGVPAIGTPDAPATGLCDAGARAGLACTSTSSTGASTDCLPSAGPGKLAPVTLPLPLGAAANPLGTGAATRADPEGLFCRDDGQTVAGCFGDAACRRIDTAGAAAGGGLQLGAATPLTLASLFCVRGTASPTLNAAAGFPAPGQVSIAGTGRLNATPTAASSVCDPPAAAGGAIAARCQKAARPGPL